MKHVLAKTWRILRLPKALQLRIMRIMNDEFLIGVTGVIFNKKNEVLLLKHTYRQTEWSLPGGYLKSGEHPKEGLIREVFEETGFTIKTEKIIRPAHDSSTARLDISCWGTFQKGTFLPSAEVNEYGFFAYDTLPEISKNQKQLIRRTLVKEKGVKLHNVSFFRKISRWFTSEK